MTTELAGNIAGRLCWFDYRTVEPTIHWDLLPAKGSQSLPVPTAPWMFGFLPNYVVGQDMWWEEVEDVSNKPEWWKNPDPKVFSIVSSCHIQTYALCVF